MAKAPPSTTGHTSLGPADPLPMDTFKHEELQVEQLKEVPTALAYGHSQEDLDFLANFDEVKKKRMYRKVDFRLIPMLALLYLICYIDRANLGNAKIEGMDSDLGIVGSQWNVCVSIFFVSYVLCEVPSNAILQRYFKTRPSYYMSILCVSWGIVTTCICALRNYGGLVAARFMLGIPEAGFFPGAILMTSYWYPRYMLQTRIALFYTSSATAGAFSGLLAFAIAKMDGLAGLAGWRWIFLVEGLATVVIGALIPFILVDGPERSKWLDEDEKRYIKLAVQTQDGGAAAQARTRGVSWVEFRKVISEWHIYFFSLMYWAAAIPNTAFTFTLPSITRGMGYRSSEAQLLTIPPYFLGAVAAYLGGRFADRARRRYPFIVGPLCIVIVSMCIVIPLAPRITRYVGPGYFAICLAHLGFYPLGPCINTWTTNSLAGPAKRAMGMAFMLAMGNSGSIIGSYIFLQSEAPSYPTGYGVAMGVSVLGITSATIIMLTFRYNNRQRERLSEEDVREKYTDDQLAELGDRSPLYRYTL